MQSSRHRSQQPLLGLKKPSPRLGFAHLDSYKTKLCEAELCRGLLAQLPALQALCWGTLEESSATDGSIGVCKGVMSQQQKCRGGGGRTRDIPPIPPWAAVGCWLLASPICPALCLPYLWPEPKVVDLPPESSLPACFFCLPGKGLRG